MMRPALLLALLALPGLLGACHPDPVHEDNVKAAGPEQPGVPTGPLHRPGQRCLVCHGGEGPASMVMSFAGTVYQNNNKGLPLANAIVRIVDSKGHAVSTGTNCAGNFFIQKKQFDPVWPAFVKIEYGQTSAGPMTATMLTPMFRLGSCNECHHDPAGPSNTLRLYAPSDPVNYPPSGCP